MQDSYLCLFAGLELCHLLQPTTKACCPRGQDKSGLPGGLFPSPNSCRMVEAYQNVDVSQIVQTKPFAIYSRRIVVSKGLQAVRPRSLHRNRKRQPSGNRYW